jgi:tRNA(fMet)-specific endonuclease VapC
LTGPFLIDTNIAIHLRDGLESVLAKMTEHRGAVALSALSLAELQRGLHKSPEDQARRRARLATILLSIPVLSFDAAAAEVYGRVIRAIGCGAIGWVKGRDFDRMIASHAISSGRALVTANSADFRDIPGLRIEDWTVAS